MERTMDFGSNTFFDGLRVLVTDDSPTTRRMFKERLEKLGIVVVEAADGVKALDILKTTPQPFDLLFCDIQMPNMNGLELCKTLHEADWFEGTPIIMVSTCSDAKEVIGALKLGADDYIPKPFERELLIKVINRVRS